jgi:hypothetical protein
MNCAVHVCVHCSLVSDFLLLQTPKGADNRSLKWLFLQISKSILIPALWDHMLRKLRGGGSPKSANLLHVGGLWQSPRDMLGVETTRHSQL